MAFPPALTAVQTRTLNGQAINSDAHIEVEYPSSTATESTLHSPSGRMHRIKVGIA